MNKKKKNKFDPPELNPANPADEGVDHNLSQGTDKDVEASYIRKQESAGGRGVDNEDDTENRREE